MNKRSKQSVWMGLLIMLLIPGVANAQTSKMIERAFDGGERIMSRSLFTRQVTEAINKLSFQYVPRQGIKPLNLASPQDLAKLEKFAWAGSLRDVTPLQLAKNALRLSFAKPHFGNLAEEITLFALNSAANPADILHEAIVNEGSFYDDPYGHQAVHASYILVEKYGLDPNGKTSNGDPIPLTLWKEVNLPSTTCPMGWTSTYSSMRSLLFLPLPLLQTVPKSSN